MLILREPSQVSNITGPDLRKLVALRFAQVCSSEAYDYDRHGYMVVVEPGDTVEQLEQETSCCITRNLFDETRYGDPDFSPSFETLEEHDECYEMVYLTSDGGFAVTLWIPKSEGIDDCLLALCATYATPANVMP